MLNAEFCCGNKVRNGRSGRKVDPELGLLAFLQRESHEIMKKDVLTRAYGEMPRLFV